MSSVGVTKNVMFDSTTLNDCRECNNYHVMIMMIMIVGVFTETPRWGECRGLYCVCILHQRSTLYLNTLH